MPHHFSPDVYEPEPQTSGRGRGGFRRPRITAGLMDRPEPVGEPEGDAHNRATDWLKKVTRAMMRSLSKKA